MTGSLVGTCDGQFLAPRPSSPLPRSRSGVQRRRAAHPYAHHCDRSRHLDHNSCFTFVFDGEKTPSSCSSSSNKRLFASNDVQDAGCTPLPASPFSPPPPHPIAERVTTQSHQPSPQRTLVAFKDIEDQGLPPSAFPSQDSFLMSPNNLEPCRHHR